MWKSRSRSKVCAIANAISAAKESAASHQMYQIIANASTTLSPDRITPAPVFFGMWIGLKPESGRL